MENKTAEEAAIEHANKHGIKDDPIAGIYWTAAYEDFMAGCKYASLQQTKDRERIEQLTDLLDQLKVDYDNLQSRSDQQEERIKELKDERDSLSQMVLEMVGESEEQIMKEFLEFKLNRKA